MQLSGVKHGLTCRSASHVIIKFDLLSWTSPHWRTLFLDILEKVLPSPPVTLILQQKGDTCLSAPSIIFPTSQFLSKRLPCSQPFWPSQACRHLPFRSTSWPFAILLLNQGSFPQLIMSGQYIHTCTCM